MKPFVMMMILLAMIVPAEAKKKGGGNAKARQQQAEKARKEKEKDRAERDKKRKGVEDLLASKDANKDKFLSRDEYIAGEANAEEAGKRFDKANKNKDRTLTKTEMEDLLGL